ncbi:hypothetical protein [Halomonas beimenensis]|uniref:Uncharacterized protein n=1 Tax=Halomonas beimenensis TaxID=475662 RepID=A0A291PCP8_9GAMM|nr:hypothetical protein [Halomonas beimenensis]ATJ84652.1 hypothetical protein BEI_3665 [Halomonas beimenensis]
MTGKEHQQVIEKLDAVIQDTRALLERFEATGMDEAMPADYQQLNEILESALKQQHEQTLAMLKSS